MQSTTLNFASCAGLRAWLVIALVLVLCISSASAAPIYSNTGATGAQVTITACALCVPPTVSNAGSASDSDLSGSFATISNPLAIASTVRLRLKLGATGQIGDRAGVLVALAPTLLNVGALGTYTIRTYLKDASTANVLTLQDTQVISADVIQGLLGGGRPAKLEFSTTALFNEVELEVSGAVQLLYSLNVYYAYAVPALTKQPVRGLASRFAGSGAALDAYYRAGTSTSGGVISACVNAGVLNPSNAVSSSLTDYASFASVATVACPAALAVKLEGLRTAPAGYYAGFAVGSSGLLDVSVLSAMRLTTYLNGVAQESATGVGLLGLNLLPNGQSQVSFPTILPFDEVRIERISTLSVLDNLNIYYGFGVEPSAFQGSTRILSDFTTANAPAKATPTVNAVVCVNCSVTNPAGAADNDPATYATLHTPIGALSNVELKLDLNGAGTNAGPAGYRAGMVISNNTGLLNLALLNGLTLTTYDAAGNLLESATGASLLSLNVLPGGKQEISFLTTQNFASVQISVASGLSLGVDLNVYQAFADNLSGAGISTITPLPVELTAFTGRWATGGAELNWATATEKNSSHFVVERSTGSEAGFVAVGQVAAAGNSTSPKKYQLLDAEAGTQGVAILYYRLRQVDLDGKEAYSPLVSVQVGKLGAAAPQLQVYPNPTADTRTVQVRFLNVPTTGGLVQTYSQMGQLMSQQTVAEATSQLTLPTLAPGLYHMVLRADNGQKLATQRLVVEGR